MQHLIGINCHFPCLFPSLTLFLSSINLLSIVIIILFIHHLTLHLIQLNSTLRCTALHKNFSVDPQRLLSVCLSVCLSVSLFISLCLSVCLSLSSSSPLSFSSSLCFSLSLSLFLSLTIQGKDSMPLVSQVSGIVPIPRILLEKKLA